MPFDTARLLEVVRLGHPILRTTAEDVPEEWFATGRLHELGQDLVRTMIESEGVGLAAPQVAEPLRLFSYWLPGPKISCEATRVLSGRIAMLGDPTYFPVLAAW